MRNFLAYLGAFALAALQSASPEASISGRVRDANGTVATTVRVAVGTLSYRDGRRVFTPNSSTQIDASGNYRLTPVSPGEYYIRVELPLTGVPTYYPGTMDIDSATKIAVRAGQEIVGVDIDLQSGPTFKVSGTLLNVPATPDSNGVVPRVLGFTFSPSDPRSPDPANAPLVQAQHGANGAFELRLPAGSWDLFPVIPMRSAAATTNTLAPPINVPLPTYVTGRSRVLIEDRDIQDIVVRVASADIKGRVRVVGSSLPETKLATVRIGLLPKDNYPSPLISHVRPAAPGPLGDFSFTAVPPGRFAFQISLMPEDSYVADIRVGSKSIYDSGEISVGADPIEPVEIVLNRGGGVVRVVVRGNDGATGSPIALVPAPPRRGNNLLYKRVASAGASDYATFNNVAPGQYKIFAFRQAPPVSAEQNAEFIAQYEDYGKTIDVVAGQTLDVELEWIPIKP